MIILIGTWNHKLHAIRVYLFCIGVAYDKLWAKTSFMYKNTTTYLRFKCICIMRIVWKNSGRYSWKIKGHSFLKSTSECDDNEGIFSAVIIITLLYLCTSWHVRNFTLDYGKYESYIFIEPRSHFFNLFVFVKNQWRKK